MAKMHFPDEPVDGMQSLSALSSHLCCGTAGAQAALASIQISQHSGNLGMKVQSLRELVKGPRYVLWMLSGVATRINDRIRVIFLRGDLVVMIM